MSDTKRPPCAVIVLPVVRAERDARFAVDDAVMLKSGGPVMTVVAVDASGKCRCAWPQMIGSELFGVADADFDPAQLDLIHKAVPA